MLREFRGRPGPYTQRVSQLPRGTVTLLFTDVESSTRLVAELGETAHELLERHRDVIRGDVKSAGGVIVDCRGDEVFAAFADPGAALKAAAAFQQRLADDEVLTPAQVRVRAGIHTGTPGVEQTGYYGLDVHRAARICSAGHGGQVLVSETTRAVVGDAARLLRDVGTQRLRGLPRPERLFQLCVPGLPESFPPLRNLEPAGSEPGVARTKVVVADDSLLLREGVVRLLEESAFDVVGQASDPEELLAEVDQSRPDVAVVDIRMPPTQTDEGIRAARRIRHVHPGVGVLMLSQFAEPAYAHDLLAEGATGVGYLLKDRVSDMLDFAAAVRRVADGGAALDSEVVKLVVDRARMDGPLAGLPEPDIELVSLLAEGRSDREIADRMVLADHDAEPRIATVLEHLGIDRYAEGRRAARILSTLGTATA